MSIGFSGASPASWCVRGDVRICNENPAILAVCLRVGRVLSRPLAIRGGVSAGHSGCDTPGCQKAPSAIRCIKTPCQFAACRGGRVVGQKAPSAIRCIKTSWRFAFLRAIRAASQKAPSAIRCIKTGSSPPFDPGSLPCQKAPSAIRCIKTWPLTIVVTRNLPCQKAPSAIRCIKTRVQQSCLQSDSNVRKHLAP